MNDVVSYSLDGHSSTRPYTQDELDDISASQPTAAQLAIDVRAKRDLLLSATDYLLMVDYPITTEKLEDVKVYRQALRDIAAQANFPTGIEWPEYPV